MWWGLSITVSTRYSNIRETDEIFLPWVSSCNCSAALRRDPSLGKPFRRLIPRSYCTIVQSRMREMRNWTRRGLQAQINFPMFRGDWLAATAASFYYVRARTRRMKMMMGGSMCDSRQLHVDGGTAVPFEKAGSSRNTPSAYFGSIRRAILFTIWF